MSHKVQLLYEQGYVTHCIGNLTNEKCLICLNFISAYEYIKIISKMGSNAIWEDILKVTRIIKKMWLKLSLCLSNQALRHEHVCGCGCIDPHFLYLGTSWRWVVSFTPPPLYPRGKCPRYLLDRRLGVPNNRSGRHGEEKILDSTGTRTPTPLLCSSVATHYTDCAIPARVLGWGTTLHAGIADSIPYEVIGFSQFT
jgi:hypothetical protein